MNSSHLIVSQGRFCSSSEKRWPPRVRKQAGEKHSGSGESYREVDAPRDWVTAIKKNTPQKRGVVDKLS